MKTKGSRNKNGVSRILTVHGYIEIFNPEHPLARKNGYVLEHRMLAWNASLIKDKNLIVHHKNGIKTDNRISNLEVTTNANHSSHHWKGVKRSEAGNPCKYCEKKTRSKYGLCQKHYKAEWYKRKNRKHPLCWRKRNERWPLE